MGSRRPLPLPPYPGVIPYQVDASEDEDVEPDENSPRLLGIEQRPVSSFGLPAQASLTQARDTFYQNWQKQQVGRGGFGYFVDCFLAQILVVECRLKRQKCCRL